MFVPKYMKVYEQMVPGIYYCTSLVPGYQLSIFDLVNSILSYDWSGGVDSLMRPLLKKGMVKMIKVGPSRNSPVCYMRVPEEDKENV